MSEVTGFIHLDMFCNILVALAWPFSIGTGILFGKEASVGAEVV